MKDSLSVLRAETSGGDASISPRCRLKRGEALPLRERELERLLAERLRDENELDLLREDLATANRGGQTGQRGQSGQLDRADGPIRAVRPGRWINQGGRAGQTD